MFGPGASRPVRIGAAAIAGGFFLLLVLPSLSPHYGFYSDELYYLACTRHLALGYVDHPPLFVWLLKLHVLVFGDSLFALRVLPAALGTATGLSAAWMAYRLGGGPFAQGLALLAAMATPLSLAIFNFLSVNALAIPLWALTSCVLIELCRTRDPRGWVALGATLGLAFLDKHTAIVPIAGVAVATLATPLRRDLRTRWPWLGAAAFCVIVAPNVYWQIANGWPSLAFYASVEDDRYGVSPAHQLIRQIVFQNPAAFPIWAMAAYALTFSTWLRPFRALGFWFLTAMAAAILGGSALPYRIAGAFPVALAAGAVAIERIRAPDAGRLRRVWNTYALPALILAVAIPAASFILPILPPPVLASNPLYDSKEGSGWRPEIGANEIPYHLGNRTHWKAFVDRVVEVWNGLEPERRADAILLVDYFGHAGALEYYGRGRGLPPVYSPMTGYFLWGPPETPVRNVISIGVDEAFVRASFDEVDVAAVFRCSYCPPVVDELPILLASGPVRPFAELWPEIGALEHRRTRLLRAQRRARDGG